MADTPSSPAPITAAGPDHLPAYLSNGVIGLPVRDIPLPKEVAVVTYHGDERARLDPH